MRPLWRLHLDYKEHMNDNKELIDRGTYYEIKDYESVVNRDENGNVVSMIHCPYIPKSLYDNQIKETE